MRFLANLVRNAASRADLEVLRRSNSFHATFEAAMERHRVSGVLDVGANDGEFARSMRSMGFRGAIHSFEPIPSAFARLSAVARRDPLWWAHEAALGDFDGRSVLLESENSVSSSLLDPLDVDAHVSEGVRTIRRVDVQVRRLDSLESAGTLRLDWSHALLKIDVQGTEDRVLSGCGRLLDEIPLLHVEVSFQPLYDGAARWLMLMGMLEDRGFTVIDLHRGFRDARNARLLQADVILERIATP